MGRQKAVEKARKRARKREEARRRLVERAAEQLAPLTEAVRYLERAVDDLMDELSSEARVWREVRTTAPEDMVRAMAFDHMVKTSTRLSGDPVRALERRAGGPAPPLARAIAEAAAWAIEPWHFEPGRARPGGEIEHLVLPGMLPVRGVAVLGRGGALADTSGTYLGWAVEWGDSMFVVAFPRLEGRRLEILDAHVDAYVNAWIAAGLDVSDDPPLIGSVVSTIVMAEGEPGEPVGVVDYLGLYDPEPLDWGPDVWSEDIPVDPGFFADGVVPVQAPHHQLRGHGGLSWRANREDVERWILRWRDHRAVKGWNWQSWMIRVRWSRELTARAKEAADLEPIRKAVRELAIVASRGASLLRGLPSREPTPAPSAESHVLEWLGVQDDATMPGARDERLKRHPVSVLALDDEVVAKLDLPTEAPIGAALERLDDHRDEAVRHAVQEAWETYRAERRWLATFGPLDLESDDDVCIVDWAEIHHAMHALFDRRASALPVADLERIERKARRPVSCLVKAGELTGEDAPLADLPPTEEILLGTKGLGAGSREHLLRTTLAWLARWRYEAAGLSPADLERHETRAAGGERLHEALDDLAGLFE
ncbi:MAG: hypothetical protein ACQEXJ_21180 [Myxococcota bacterium]